MATRRAPPPGDAAESLVADRLVAAGWTLCARRLRLGALEIDLLVRRGDLVAVVEVRGRRLDGWRSPLDSIGPTKQRRLARAARRLWFERFADDPTARVIRIDVAGVTFGVGPPEVEIVEGAIDPELR